MLIDTHCHINSLAASSKTEALAQSESDYIFIDISIDLETARQSVALSGEYKHVYSSLGFHPFSADKFSGTIIDEYRALIESNNKIVAIGEVGLDYKAHLPAQKQKEILSEFVRLSKDYHVALIVHNRWHNNLILDILNEHFADFQTIVFHCFSEDKEFLAKVIEKKGYVSFALNILRAKPKIIESLQAVGLDNLLLETDSPYMRIHGEYSTPLDIEKVYRYVAGEKGISLLRLSDVIRVNSQKVFGIKTN